MSYFQQLDKSIIDQATKITSQPQVNLGTTIAQDLDAMRVELTLLRQQYQRPKTFIKSPRATSSSTGLSSNVGNDVLIFQGEPVPAGYRGVVSDFNLTFNTVAGTIKWVIVDTNGRILSNVVTSIAASQNGVGSTVIEEGQSLAIVGQTAGAGTFDSYCTGFIYKSVGL